VQREARNRKIVKRRDGDDGDASQEFRVKASPILAAAFSRPKGRRGKVSNSAPSFRRVVSSPYLRAPFFLSSCSSGSP